MKPLLASLVLLLLALCRPTSSTCSKAARDATDNIADGDKLLQTDVFSDILNLGIATDGACGVPMKYPGLAKIANNGILCTLEKKTPAQIKTALYGANDRSQGEDLLAKDLGIDCAAAPTANEVSKCYCGLEKNTIMWCAALKYKEEKLAGVTKGQCMDDALLALQASGTKVLGKHFGYSEAAKHKDEGALKAVFSKSANAIDAITTWAGDEMNNFFCDAISSDVEAKLKALYDTDVQFVILEFAIMSAAFGKDGLVGLKFACGIPEFKAQPFGDCVCDETHGFFTFCVYKALGKEFQKAGFLDCEAKKFVAEKKPAVVPDILKGLGSSPSKDAASPATTASSLMMVPLMAAAVLLARH